MLILISPYFANKRRLETALVIPEILVHIKQGGNEK